MAHFPLEMAHFLTSPEGRWIMSSPTFPRRRLFRLQAAELFEGNVKDDDFGKVVSISGLSDELPIIELIAMVIIIAIVITNYIPYDVNSYNYQ